MLIKKNLWFLARWNRINRRRTRCRGWGVMKLLVHNAERRAVRRCKLESDAWINKEKELENAKWERKRNMLKGCMQPETWKASIVGAFGTTHRFPLNSSLSWSTAWARARWNLWNVKIFRENNKYIFEKKKGSCGRQETKERKWNSGIHQLKPKKLNYNAFF